jgi:hypothetical protein
MIQLTAAPVGWKKPPPPVCLSTLYPQEKEDIMFKKLIVVMCASFWLAFASLSHGADVKVMRGLTLREEKGTYLKS